MSSDRIVQSDHDTDEIHETSLQPFQSAWMSHWTRARYGRPLDDAQKLLTFPQDSGKTSDGSKHQSFHRETQIEAGSSKFVKEFREMHKVATVNEVSTSVKKSRPDASSKSQQQFPMFKSSQNSDGTLSMKDGKSSDHQKATSRSQIGPASGYEDSASQTDQCSLSMHELTPSKIEIQTESQGIVSNPSQKVHSSKLLEEHRIVISTPLKDEYLGSTSRIVPEFDSGRTPTESFLCRQGYINQSSGTFLVHERNTNNNAALWIDDPSTSDSRLRDFLDQKIPKMPSRSDFKLFHSHKRASEARVYHKSFELPRIPSFVHDVETMKICSTIGSVEEFTICPSKISQTTHHLLIANKTDVNLSDRGHMLRESTISTKFEDQEPGGFLSLPPDFGFNAKQGVKLQPLDSSTDSEAKENIENICPSGVDLKNESSAETATMDMDTFRVNHLSGVVSSIPNKDMDGDQESRTLAAAIASVKEGNSCKLPSIVLPDINQEAPAIPGVATSADEEEEVSTSKTQSLDVEHFLPHVDHPTNSKSGACADASSGLDPYSRWVKRLRPSSSDSFALGTKSWQMGEATSHEKVKRFFSKMLNNNKTSSETKMNKSFGKQHMMADKTADLLRNVTSPTNSGRKNQDITLSHAWIQRWCHNEATSSKKKSEALVVHEPSSKAKEENFPKKQFPSIAAMALMGKAMNGFHPCEFRKRGSFVVWNTKGQK